MQAAALPVDKSVPTPRSPELPLSGPDPAALVCRQRAGDAHDKRRQHAVSRW